VGLFLEPGSSPPVLGGVAPVEGRGGLVYPNLRWPLEFSGRLLIAQGFIQTLYRHMGFHPAWKFEESWEIDFQDGRMTNSRDLSEEMRALRSQIAAGDIADPDDESQPGWIERTFRLDFRRSQRN
jgi:hypothetical protein